MEFLPMITGHGDTRTTRHIALLGAGGKTALLHRLGEEAARERKVLLTSLTKAGPDSPHPVHWLREYRDREAELARVPLNPLYVMDHPLHAEKVQGLDAGQLAGLLHYFEMSIFECDGARKRSLKAHTDWDPMVPDYATNVILVVGADVVGTRVGDGLVHRPERFCELWGVRLEGELTPEFVARILSAPEGYRSKLSGTCSMLYFVNKSERFPQAAKTLGAALAKQGVAPCAVGSVQAGEWTWAEDP